MNSFFAVLLGGGEKDFQGVYRLYQRASRISQFSLNLSFNGSVIFNLNVFKK